MSAAPFHEATLRRAPASVSIAESCLSPRAIPSKTPHSEIIVENAQAGIIDALNPAFSRRTPRNAFSIEFPRAKQTSSTWTPNPEDSDKRSNESKLPELKSPRAKSPVLKIPRGAEVTDYDKDWLEKSPAINRIQLHQFQEKENELRKKEEELREELYHTMFQLQARTNMKLEVILKNQENEIKEKLNNFKLNFEQEKDLAKEIECQRQMDEMFIKDLKEAYLNPLGAKISLLPFHANSKINAPSSKLDYNATSNTSNSNNSSSNNQSINNNTKNMCNHENNNHHHHHHHHHHDHHHHNHNHNHNHTNACCKHSRTTSNTADNYKNITNNLTVHSVQQDNQSIPKKAAFRASSTLSKSSAKNVESSAFKSNLQQIAGTRRRSESYPTEWTVNNELRSQEMHFKAMDKKKKKSKKMDEINIEFDITSPTNFRNALRTTDEIARLLKEKKRTALNKPTL